MKSTIRAADLFAGAGGASTGLARACQGLGIHLDLVAVNHDPVAVETHRANHPTAVHFCETIDAIDPLRAVPSGRLDLLLAGPSCQHHSIARGGKPMHDQARATAWAVVRWAEALRPRVVVVENVREFKKWGPLSEKGRPIKSKAGDTFRAWLNALQSLGYQTDHRILNAADYGDPTTRERLFVVAWRGRTPWQWPVQTHAREGGQRTLFGGSLPRWRAAREIIDWGLSGESILRRKRPLSENTLRRIQEGLRRFCGAAAEPFILQLSQSGSNGARMRSAGEPLPTITTAKGGDMALVEPFLLGQQSGSVPRSTEEPIPTVATDGAISLVSPFLVPANYGERPGQTPRTHDLDEPLPTVVGQLVHGLVEPFMVTLRGTSEEQVRGSARPASEPVPTLAAKGTHVGLVEPFLVNYHGQGGRAFPVHEPLRTVDAKDRYALVHGEIVDVRFRMLRPHELAAAMSFPSDYIFRGNQGDVVRQIGNAWAGELSRALALSALEVAA